MSSITRRFDVNDPDNEVAGDDFGVKGVIELWLNLGPNAWTSLDLAYTTAHETGSARWRAGWRMLPTVSLGPEVRYDINAEDEAGRVGAFSDTSGSAAKSRRRAEQPERSRAISRRTSRLMAP